MKVFNLAVVVASVVFVVAAQQASAAALVTTYTQNFDSMGTSGTTPPTDWILKSGESGTGNTTWASSITANGASGSVASMVNAATPLTAITTPANANNNGYNAAAVPGSDTSNRVLSTSPTGVSGAAIQLTLTNGTGGTLNSMSVGYDIDRFTAVGTANELPGYQLFYSLDSGSTWANVATLNPTLSGPGVSVPNTAGITNVPLTAFSLSAPWNSGSDLLLRWVDDNAVQTSPDQIIGLDNVTVSTVPEPATVGILALAAVAVIQRRRRSV